MSFFDMSGGALNFLLDASKAIGTGTSWGQYGSAVVNRHLPLSHIGFSECLKLYYQGKITWDALRFYASLSGIGLPADARNPGNPAGSGQMEAAWAAVVQSGTPVPDLEAFTTWYRRGMVSDWYYDRFLRHYGLDPNNYKSIIVDCPNPPTPLACMEMLNRGYMTVDEFDKAIKAYGMGDETDRRNFAKMRFQLPPTADLIRFSVREVWNEPVVARFGYDEEFPQAFQYWMDKQGLGWTPGPDTVPGRPGETLAWTRAYWRAHFEVMSPSQSFQAVHRLRPASPGSENSRVPGVRAFLPSDLDTILKVHDYPPAMREWLSGLTYHPLTRVDIRRMLSSGVINQAEAIESYRDLGYTQRHATDLVLLGTAIDSESKNRGSITRMKNQLLRAFEFGTITRDAFCQGFFDLLHFGTQYAIRINDLEEPERTRRKCADPSVNLAVREVELRVQNLRIKTATDALVKAFVEERLTLDELRNRLAQAGIAEPRIADIVVRAQWKLAKRARVPTLERLRHWRQVGLLPAGEYREELAKLGFDAENVNLFVSETESDIIASVAKTDELLAVTTERANKAILTQIKAIRQKEKEAQKRLAKRATKAEVLRWYSKGLISRAIAERRLLRLGYAPADIELYLNEARKRASRET